MAEEEQKDTFCGHVANSVDSGKWTGFVRNFGTKKMVVCTKLVQWLTVIAVFMEVWYGLISGWMGIQLSTPVSEALIPVRSEKKRLSNPTHHVILFVVVV